jgi:DNA-directed RNA polymerase specialized sigma24 family protein
MEDTHDITQILQGVWEGDDAAAEIIWRNYFEKLVRLARRKLDQVPRRAVDEEDVALSAMHSFYRGMEGGRFDCLSDRNELWKLLVTITARKACKYRRREYAAKRGGGQVRGESVFLRQEGGEGHEPGIGDILGDEPTPELACMVAENCNEALERLGDDTLRNIAVMTLEGYSTPEIAEKLGCVRRTVERKLERIRDKWSNEQI